MRPGGNAGIVVAGIVAMGLGLGCRQPLPPTRHYRLSLPPGLATPGPAPRCADGRRPSIAVEELEVAAVYDDPRIVYRESEYQLEHYDYHLWGAVPGRLVGDALRGGYAASERFEQVVGGWERGMDGVVQGRLLALEEVDRSRTEWVAHVELQLELVDARTEQPLWSQHYEVTRPLPARSPEGLAAATSAVLGEIVEQSASAIATALVERPGGCEEPLADPREDPAEPASADTGRAVE